MLPAFLKYIYKRYYKNYCTNGGFTLAEIIVVVGIVVILAGLTFTNLTPTQRQSGLNSSLNILVADLKQQQIKAMAGDTEGRSTPDNYGIYFGTSTYTLFHGSSYSSSDTANQVVKLDNDVVVSNITFPSNVIIFTQVSGEILNFVNGSNTVTIKNVTGNLTKTITINRYGVITSIN